MRALDSFVAAIELLRTSIALFRRIIAVQVKIPENLLMKRCFGESEERLPLVTCS